MGLRSLRRGWWLQRAGDQLAGVCSAGVPRWEELRMEAWGLFLQEFVVFYCEPLPQWPLCP